MARPDGVNALERSAVHASVTVCVMTLSSLGYALSLHLAAACSPCNLVSAETTQSKSRRA